MKKVSVIGHFAYGLEYLDGQTIKTKILTEELGKQFGDEEVITLDTHGCVKTVLKAPFQVISALKKSHNVIILPAHNGVRVFGRLLPFLKRFFKGRKIYYVVVGGWLPRFLKKRKCLAKSLKRFDGIYVETSTMKKELERQQFSNVFVLPNCKKLTILEESELNNATAEPYQLCIFSRIMKEKGIEDALFAVKKVNEQLGRTVFMLDIYGPVDSNQIDWFTALQKGFPEYVQYKGTVPYDQSTETLKKYFALVFPTRFYTEGIPGTIIDAYAAGLPVISSKWESFSDVVDDGKTGLGYEFENIESLENLLFKIVATPEIVDDMRYNCLIKASLFLPEKIIKDLIRCI